MYRKVRKGVVGNDIEWMTADTDHKFHIAPANEPLNEENHFVNQQVQERAHLFAN